jgi:hypothetical protein
MRCFRIFSLACIVTAALATSHPPAWADWADRARALPAEFAADALLRIAAAPGLTDVAWKRQTLEDAFHLAAGAQQPYARRNWKGTPANLFDKASAQGLDACTLQCRVVDALLPIDYKKARELFSEMPAPRIAPLTCNEALVADVFTFYATLGEVASRAFNAKEVADEEPFHLMQRFAADLSSPVQAAPIARMLTSASLKPPQFEALVTSFAGALQQLSGDGRSFAAAVNGETDAAISGLAAECARRHINAQPLQEAWHAYQARDLKSARCATADDAKAEAAGKCESPECRRLAAQFAGFVMGANGVALTPEQKSTSEWGGKLRQYLSALADWTGGDDPVEFFQAKSDFYGELFELAPNGPERAMLLSSLLMWLQQNGYQRDHRVEWFYPVNTLLIQAFADPHGMQTTIRELLNSPDPVVSFYAQLEQVLPRPVEHMIGLL